MGGTIERNSFQPSTPLHGAPNHEAEPEQSAVGASSTPTTDTKDTKSSTSAKLPRLCDSLNDSYSRNKRRASILPPGTQGGAQSQKGAEPPCIGLDLEKLYPPETPNQRLQRIITTPLPKAPTAPSAKQYYERTYDRTIGPALNKVLRGVGLSPKLRAKVQDTVKSAIGDGLKKALEAALDAAGVKGKAQNAIIKGMEAAVRTPLA